MPTGETYHYDNFRSGQINNFHFPVDGPGMWGKYASLSLGPVRGGPIFVSSSKKDVPTAATLIIVSTCRNEILAFSEDQLLSGSVAPVWTTRAFSNIKAPSQRGGSNIPPPIGICGTPVVDPSTRRLYVLALTDGWDQRQHGPVGTFFLYVLNVDTGVLIDSIKLEDHGAPGRPTFDSNTLDNRGALALAPDRDGHVWLYATFASFLAEDHGQYHGWVVAIDPTDLKSQAFFPFTKTIIGGGVWGPGGAAVGPDGSVYVATGNGLKNDTGDQVDDHYWDSLEDDNEHPPDIGDYFEAVVRLSLSNASREFHVDGWYMPENAQDMNDDDLDLGGSSVMVVQVGRARTLLVVTSKKADMFLLPDLQGRNWGGALDRVQVFDGIPGVQTPVGRGKGAPAHWHAPDGTEWIYVSGAGTPGLAAYTLETDQHGSKFRFGWKATCSTIGVPFGKWPGSPIVTTDSQNRIAWVWVVDDGNLRDTDDLKNKPTDTPDNTEYVDRLPIPVLRAFDAANGTEMYNSSWFATDAVDPSATKDKNLHFPPMVCTHKSVIVGTEDGLACYGPLPKVKGPATVNMVVLHIDHPDIGNSAYFRIGRDLDPHAGRVRNGWTWSAKDLAPGTDYRVSGWIGNETQGAGVALADIDLNGRLDLIAFHIDNSGGDFNKGYYRILRNLGWGGATGGPLPADPQHPHRIDGWFGKDTEGGGIATVDLSGTGVTDLIAFHMDRNGTKLDKGYYRIGKSLSPQTGEAAIWVPNSQQDPLKITGEYGKDVQTCAIACASIREPSKHDIIVFWVVGTEDDKTPKRDVDKGYYMIGWDLDPTTGII